MTTKVLVAGMLVLGMLAFLPPPASAGVQECLNSVLFGGDEFEDEADACDGDASSDCGYVLDVQVVCGWTDIDIGYEDCVVVSGTELCSFFSLANSGGSGLGSGIVENSKGGICSWNSPSGGCSTPERKTPLGQYPPDSPASRIHDSVKATVTTSLGTVVVVKSCTWDPSTGWCMEDQ